MNSTPSTSIEPFLTSKSSACAPSKTYRYAMTMTVVAIVGADVGAAAAVVVVIRVYRHSDDLSCSPYADNTSHLMKWWPQTMFRLNCRSNVIVRHVAA